MPIALSMNETWPYILKEDQEAYRLEVQKHRAGERADAPKEPTVFTLRPIKASDLARIEDQMATGNKDGDVRVALGSQALETLKLGLEGWKDFFFGDGTEAKFQAVSNGRGRPNNMMVATDECLSYLRPEDRRELVQAIDQRIRVSVEDLGN